MTSSIIGHRERDTPVIGLIKQTPNAIEGAVLGAWKSLSNSCAGGDSSLLPARARSSREQSPAGEALLLLPALHSLKNRRGLGRSSSRHSTHTLRFLGACTTGVRAPVLVLKARPESTKSLPSFPPTVTSILLG
jgi:hypothetical protein